MCKNGPDFSEPLKSEYFFRSKICCCSLTAIVSLANALSVTVDDLLCDSVVKSKVQFEKDIAGILADCDEYEIRMVKDMAQALKETLRRDAHLRKQ